MVCGFMPTPFLIGGTVMCLIMRERIEIELFPDALRLIDSICNKTGATRSEVIEKTFLKYLPIEEERAIDLIRTDVITRTERLSEEGKERVLLKMKEIIDKI